MSLWFIATGCGSKVQPRIEPTYVVTGLKVSGTITDINNQPVVISENPMKPRIFIFASTFCGVCQGEHRNLRDLMATNGGVLPTNVDIYTIMTGAVDNMDSLDFKDFTQIQWNPFYQVNDELRNTLCGIGTANPCVVVEKPNEGVIFKHTGEVSIQELQILTGAWVW